MNANKNISFKKKNLVVYDDDELSSWQYIVNPSIFVWLTEKSDAESSPSDIFVWCAL